MLLAARLGTAWLGTASASERVDLRERQRPTGARWRLRKRTRSLALAVPSHAETSHAETSHAETSHEVPSRAETSRAETIPSWADLALALLLE